MIENLKEQLQQKPQIHKMIFSLKDLYVGANFSISKQIEQLIVEQLQKLYDLPDSQVEISQGYNSAYDFRLAEKLFELKIMSTPYYNIEVSRASGAPSGLTSSKSDYYIIVNPGYLYGKECMKIRIVSVPALKQAVNLNTKVKFYEPNIHNTLGSVCHQLDAKTLEHDFVGIFEIVEKRNTDYYIDFASIQFFPLGRFCSLHIHNALKL